MMFGSDDLNARTGPQMPNSNTSTSLRNQFPVPVIVPVAAYLVALHVFYALMPAYSSTNKHADHSTFNGVWISGRARLG
jgi:hypothetical protein